MTKADIVDKIYEKVGLSKKDSTDCVVMVFPKGFLDPGLQEWVDEPVSVISMVEQDRQISEVIQEVKPHQFHRTLS